MKTFWVSLGAVILLAGYGNADVSDSGNLTIGNSAQFGSGATRSTFTTTGSLNLANNASLTLPGSSGNIVSASSVTASTFFGDGSHLTGVNTNASITETFISSQDVVNVTTVTFNSGQGTVLSSSTTYRLHYVLQNSSSTASSMYYLLINGDASAHYGETVGLFTSAGYAGEGPPSGGYGFELCATDQGTYQIYQGGQTEGNIYIETEYGTNATNNVRIYGAGLGCDSSAGSTDYFVWTITGKYSGSAVLSSIQIIGGTNFVSNPINHQRAVTGHVEIWKGLSHK